MIGASFLAISDMFIVSSMIFVIGQLQILQHQLKNLGKMLQGDTEKLKKDITDCVEHHCEIIK